jgi:hypothetical protein
MRAVLVLRIWDSACTGWMSIPVIESFGYKRNGRTGALELVYDFEVQMKRIEAQVELVLRGCGCKTGCESRKCKCQKVGERCSVACRCVSCKNIPVQARTAEDSGAAVGQPAQSAEQARREPASGGNIGGEDGGDDDEEWLDEQDLHEENQNVIGKEEDGLSRLHALDQGELNPEDEDAFDDFI